MDRSEIEALMEPVADMVARYELTEATTCKEEASRPDSDFESVPLKAPFGLTALVRHASLLTGFSYSELDPILGAGDGFCAGLAVGDVGRPGVLGHVDPGLMVVFVNASRAALSADPEVDLRRWWTEKRHGKHSTPLELLLDGRWDEKISHAYRLELSDFPPSAVRTEEDFSFGEQSVFAYRR